MYTQESRKGRLPVMRYFQDLILLFVFGLSAVLFTEITPSFIIAFLFAMILICACYFLESRALRIALSCLYLAGALFIPVCFCFYPVMFYLLLRDGQFVCGLFGILFYLYHILVSNMSAVQIFFGCLTFAAAWILQTRTQEYNDLSLRFYHTRDDSQERELLLTEKNESLLEMQNYEIYAATLRERNRIAREIHDNVGHILSRSILLTGALKTLNTQEELSLMLENLDTSLNSAMDSIRTSVHDLHDEAVGLEEAVRAMAAEFTFCPVQLNYDMGMELPKDVKYCFISITKEALANIIKHSNATKVTILMREHPALYQLCIEDNGTVTAQSSPPDCFTAHMNTSRKSSGIGLSNMKERVRSLNGTFQMIQQQGFKIFITIPKQ